MLLAAESMSYSFFFMLFAALACLFAVAVLFTGNIVRMAFYLTLSLGATAGLFFLAGAEFVGAMQLMIYVGGTMVLLIFGVMLTAQARFISLRTPSGEWVLAIIVGSALLFMLLVAAFGVPAWRTPAAAADLSIADAQTATPVGAALSGIRVDKLNTSETERAGTYSGYVLPFVIVSVHLLVVLIGAAYMARAKASGSAITPDRDDSTAGP
jgi:NADH-quinone oxidoreductase subunit J